MSNKPTDSEIIKALKCCLCDNSECLQCQNKELCRIECDELATKTIDLITRQQAENENLKVENQSLRSAANSLKMHYEEAQAEIGRYKRYYYRHEYDKWEKEIKAEAYKEFAERLKIEAMTSKNKRPSLILEGAVDCSCIDRVLKEILSDNNDS